MNIDQSTWDAIWIASKAPFLAFMTAILRGWYSGKRRWRTRIIEGLLMALATVAILPVIQYMGLDRDMTVFFGVFFGFVGVDTLSEWARKWGITRLVGGNNGNSR